MSARWVTWIGAEAATVELVERGDAHVVARIETDSGVREVRFAVVLRQHNGEALVRLPDGRGRASWVGPPGQSGPARAVRTVSVDGRDVVVRALRELDAWLGADDDGAGSGAVTVAMPGRVVKVLAQVGDHVDKGEPVMIVEAMKMENEVKAPRGGVVKAVAVREGAAVEGGAVLMEIGPDPKAA
jgi:biotin carboxyl carrier protein